MKLTVEHNIIADLNVIALQLRQGVGAFDLTLLVHLTTTPPPALPVRRWARIDSVGVHLTSANGGGHLATLRPVSAVRVEQFDNTLTQQVEFQAPLQRRQLLALEDLRDGKDLNLRLSVAGVGGVVDDDVGRVPVSGEHTIILRRSEWIDQLNAAGAAGILLLEASIPLAVGVDDAGIARKLQSAETAFHNGDYGKCIGDCRLAYDRLGLTATPKATLPDKQLDMSFLQRVDLLIASARHCTHLPHHDDGDGNSEHVYSREEARFVLQVTAAAAAYWLKAQ
jgi:hypothetical protein